MLPCVRSCIGKKVNPLPAACADLYTNEPLLFLYPSWFRNASKNISRGEPSRSRRLSTLPTRRSRTAAVTKEDEEQISYPSGISDDKVAGRRPKDAASPSSEHGNGQEFARLSLPKVLAAQEWRPFAKNTPKTLRQAQMTENVSVSPDKKKPIHRNVPSEITSRGILKLARKLSKLQQSDADDQEQLLLKAEFLEWLTGTSGENMWKHHDGSGCLVHIRVRSADDQQERQVVLIGTARAREIAAMHLKALEKDYRDLHHTGTVEDKQKTEKIKMSTYKTVDCLPRPHTWNVRAFSDYVGTVVNSQIPKGVERVLYSTNQTFNQTVAQALVKTFTDPELSPFLSSFALRQALVFLCSRTDVAFAATAIWRAVRSADIVPDINCFNYELSRCIRVGNITGVKRLLNEMRFACVQPDITTWVHLFKLISSRQHQHEFFNLLPVQNIGHDQMLTEMIIQTRVDDEFEPSDEHSTSVLNFQEKMQQNFGDLWLTPPVARRMIEKCISTNALRSVSSVLKIASSPSMRSDPASFDTILKAVAQTGWFADALTLLQIQTSHAQLPLSESHIELLFEVAWKQRLVNTARVLWHYAASHGSIRHGMVTRISQEVAQNVHPTADANPRLSAWMAAMAIGTDLALTSSSALDVGKEHDLFSNIVESLKFWTTDGELRHNQLQVVHLLIERDMTAWQRVKPIEYAVLIDLLEKAHRMDLAWQDQHLILTHSFSSLLRQTIPINLMPSMPNQGLSENAGPASLSTNTPVAPFVDSNRWLNDAAEGMQVGHQDTKQQSHVSASVQSTSRFVH